MTVLGEQPLIQAIEFAELADTAVPVNRRADLTGRGEGHFPTFLYG